MPEKQTSSASAPDEIQPSSVSLDNASSFGDWRYWLPNDGESTATEILFSHHWTLAHAAEEAARHVYQQALALDMPIIDNWIVLRLARGNATGIRVTVRLTHGLPTFKAESADRPGGL